MPTRLGHTLSTGQSVTLILPDGRPVHIRALILSQQRVRLEFEHPPGAVEIWRRELAEKRASEKA